jgi:hypothetical protein
VLTEHKAAIPYPKHTWGPAGEDNLIKDPDKWHNPKPDLNR